MLLAPTHARRGYHEDPRQEHPLSRKPGSHGTLRLVDILHNLNSFCNIVGGPFSSGCRALGPKILGRSTFESAILDGIADDVVT